MKISLILPVYNSESTIKLALASALHQTYNNYEVIIVDDGSTDNTPRLIEEFSKDNHRIKVIHQSNQGPLLARRKGMAYATGQYYMFMDSDDLLRDDAIEICSHVARAYDPDIISFQYSDRPDFAEEHDTLRIQAGMYAGHNYQLIRMLACQGKINELWNKAFRAELFDIQTDYSEFNGLKFGEDWFQLLPVVDAAQSFYRINDVLYYYNRSELSGTSKYCSSQLDNLAVVTKRLYEYAKKWGEDCIRAAEVGEANQYLYIVKIIVSSNKSTAHKNKDLREVRQECCYLGVFERSAGAPFRIDDKCLLTLLHRGPICFTRITAVICLHTTRLLRLLYQRIAKSKFIFSR